MGSLKVDILSWEKGVVVKYLTSYPLIFRNVYINILNWGLDIER